MTERMRLGACAFCRQEVLQGERAFFEVLGWEQERRQGGTNALRLRSRTGSVAHALCVDRAVRGREGQLALTLPSEPSATVGSTRQEGLE
jgi:hypothetical protein